MLNYIYREREYNLMETQTRLSRHNKFISAESAEINLWRLNRVWVSIKLYYIHSEWEFCYTLANKYWTNNSHTLSTLIDLYGFSHIFYIKNNPHLLSLDTDRIFQKYKHIYIYMYVCFYITLAPWARCDTNFIFKWSLKGLKSEFSFS